MECNAAAIDAICEVDRFIERMEKEPRYYKACHYDNSRRRSFSIWAATELSRRLIDNVDKPPLPILEEFEDEMYQYEQKNKLTGQIFTYARHMTRTIINMLTTV